MDNADAKASSAPYEPSTPTRERCVTSYPARRGYRPGVVFPPEVPNVAGTIDIHCHAHEGQQDALALAKLASQSGMGGLLFKTIGAIGGDYDPTREVAAVREALHRWADEEGVAPVECWVGYGIAMDNRPPSMAALRTQLARGAAAIWLPVFNHANTYSKVGGKLIWWDKTADPAAHSGPLVWAEAVARGHYMLDERARLKPDWREMIDVVMDHGAALFFGHATHAEIDVLADLVHKRSYPRAVIDHPFSPFVDLDVPYMQRLAAAGIYLNFTYDELSPLLGVDPRKMYEAIRAVGPAHCTLSSDAGEPLFPNSVECMRLIIGYMEAFGVSKQELHRMTQTNPVVIVNAEPAHQPVLRR